MYFHGKKNLLGSVLVSHGLITEEQLEAALRLQKQTNLRLGETLVSNGWITEEDLSKGISKQLFIPFVKISDLDPDLDALCIIPQPVAERLDILPLGKTEDNRLKVAIAEPLNLLAIDEIHLLSGMEVELVVSTATQIRNGIRRWYTYQECSHIVFESEKSFKLGEILFTSGLLSEKQIKQVLEEQNTTHNKFGEIILSHGWINELQLTDAISKQLQIPMVLLASHEPSPEALRLIPRDIAERYTLLPLSILDGNKLQVAISEPLPAEAVFTIRKSTDHEIIFALALPTAIEREIPRFYRTIEISTPVSQKLTQKGALLGDILINDGAITRKKLDEALQEQRVNRMRLGDILIKNGEITELQLTRAISTQLGLPMVSLEINRPTPEALAVVPKFVAQRLEVIPLTVENGYLVVAIAEPLNLLAIDELRSFTGMNIELMVTTPTEIRSRLAVFYSGADPRSNITI